MDKMMSVNKERLIYAREHYGFSVDEASERIKIKKELLQKCEAGDDFLSYAQLSNLAECYNQPLLFFFMLGDLPQNKLDVAFRSLESKYGMQLSKKAKEMLEQAEIFRLNLSEIYERQQTVSFIDLVNSQNISEANLTVWLRKELDLSIVKQQVGYSSASVLIDYLREKFYEIGIYIFKDSFKDNLVSGLCLYDDKFPIILLNNKTTFNRQLFTIFHEVFHIYNREADVSYTNNTIEKKCDGFASEFLIPQTDFDNRISHITEFEDVNTIEMLAKLYTVSKDAIAYRLMKLTKISPDFYSNIREDSIRHMNSESSGGNYYFTKMSYLGKPYLNKVFDLYYNGNLSISQVGTYTFLKPIHVSQLASNMFGGGF